MDVSVVIPVYNSAAILPQLLQRLAAALDALGLDWEVILVDDGSSDQSWQVLVQAQAQHAGRLVVVQLMRNYGQHNALMCGFRHVQGRFIITMDDDLQHPPEEIPVLLAALRAGDLDLVYGAYRLKVHRRWRNGGSALINAFYRYVFKSPVTVTSFRAIRRELVESILSYSLNFTFVDGLLAWNTQRVGEVAVQHCPRADGRSGYSLRKLTLLALNLFTNFSLLPLQLASACGVLSAGLGFFTAFCYLMLRLFSQIAVPGYASIIIALLTIGGLHLLALGIIGEYLGRLHLNVNRKPQYVERQALGLIDRGVTLAGSQRRRAS